MVSPEAEELRWNLIADARADVIGVYEALWEANALWPDKPASDRLRIAEEAISSALADGLLVIEVGSWADGTKAVSCA